MTTIPVTFVSSHAGEGGSERYLQRLLAGLGREWVHEVVCLEDGPLVNALRNDGYDVTVIEVPPRPPRLLTSLLPLRRHLRDSSSRLVHANGVKAAFACSLARTGTGLRILWVKHDFSFEGMFASSIGASVDRIVGVSNAVIARLRGPAARKATYVHTGIDRMDVDRGAARRALLAETGWPDDSFIVGAIGRLDPVKGHAELIRAGALLARRIPSTRIAIVGRADPHHPDMQQRLRSVAAEQNIEDRVAILSAIDDVRTAMAGFDAGVIATIARRRGGGEGFSLVAVEMLDAGTPVVAFRSGALPEVIGACGLFTDEGNVEGLATLLQAVAEDSDLVARVAECGRARVSSDFTTERWIEEMKAEYERLGQAG